ncbi:acyl-CoA dehydrogenase family protein [Polyangium aurulentum]|uniref:acyl-CoA dehydrogenase family protein n=1 Tax=Polyangium aurulentum TaxID=2567896 RepID=UPI0010AE2312|nr:acyl-CoA dehydrogenase family protein [Polyangium aurulentum]UQA57566.1 acyl-CoA dehydrogenase family protein [Polyangium aurulentum]
MASFYRDNADLRFYVERYIDWPSIVRLTERDFQREDGFKSTDEALEFYREILDTIGTFAAEEIAPHAGRIDREGVIFEGGEPRFPPLLTSIFDKLRRLELNGMCLPRELGGLNAPALLYFIGTELFGRADVSVMAHHGFHGGIALAMLAFSMREGTTGVDPATGRIQNTRFRAFIDEIVRGEAWGCMDITEPDAGSDMARLRTRAEEDGRGNWLVTGQKIFITSGHGKYHFVIARTEPAKNEDDPLSGLSGLSMFLVPTYEDLPDGSRRRIVTIDRVEDKLGHHASVTAALSFDRAPAFLVGKRGEGFQYMLTMMNNARIGVGFECLGLCEAALALARGYAADRRSMGKTLDRHEMIADYLDEMATDAQAIRALAMHGAYHEEMSQKKSMLLGIGRKGGADAERLEREIARHKRAARRVTPLVKYLGAEKAVEMARRCVQIHGGVGYTKDYGAEKLLRDATVMPIYEGTSQIQSLMAMKDALGGILKSPAAFLERGAEARLRALSARDPLERKLGQIQVMSHAAQKHLVMRTAGDKLRAAREAPIAKWSSELLRRWDPKRDFSYALLHAERLTRILTDEAVGELFLAQATACPERRELLLRHLERAEPRVRHLSEQITTTGDRLLVSLRGVGEAAREEKAAEAAK